MVWTNQFTKGSDHADARVGRMEQAVVEKPQLWFMVVTLLYPLLASPVRHS
jgi:hypothetical protein